MNTCKFPKISLLHHLMISSKKGPSRSAILMKFHLLAIFHKLKKNYPSQKSTEAIIILHLQFLLRPMTPQKQSLLHNHMSIVPFPAITRATMPKSLTTTQSSPPKTTPSWISSETCSNRASMKAVTAKKTSLDPPKSIFSRQKRYCKHNSNSKDKILQMFTLTLSRRLTSWTLSTWWNAPKA